MEVMKVFKVTICLMFMVLCVGGIIYCVQGMQNIPKAPDPMQEFNSHMEQNYTAYLDGEEVDPVKLDVTKYSVTYNDEVKAIYLTRKEESRSSCTYLLFLIPALLILYVSVGKR